jgi:hypothetical protein
MASRQDFFYPLPKERLRARYRQLFDAVAMGNSATSMGFSQSGDWVFLKFIFSQPDLMKVFIPERVRHNLLFLTLDFDSLPQRNALSFHKHLLFQIHQLIAGQKAKYPKELLKLLIDTPQLIKSNDAYAMFQYSNRLLSLFVANTGYRVTFVIHDYFLETWDEAWGRNLYKLWHIHRKHPDARISIFFVTKPYITPDLLPPFLKPLRWAYYETVVHFPLFDRMETEYTIDRHQKLYGVPVNDRLKTQIWETFGGFYDFYLPALRIAESYPAASPRELEKAWFADETIVYNARFLYDNLPPGEQVSLESFFRRNMTIPQRSLLYTLGVQPIPKIWKHYAVEIRPRERVTAKTIPTATASDVRTVSELTASEYEVLNYLVTHKNRLVSKDEIAGILWGPDDEQHTDWSIDKIISRLRGKISTPRLLNPILTVRGKGYKLIL